MHLVERYALGCGAKIDKPYLYEKFFPKSIEKYITIHPYTKPAKTYDYWQEVINLLLPVLQDEGINIIQVGGKDEARLNGCGSTAGQTNINQIGYLLKDTLLHLGVDSFPVHVSSGYGKKIVALYSTNHINNAKPYWGDPKDHILLEPDRGENKPSFSIEESPKTINTICPKKIAESVCSLLGLELNFNYDYVHIGPTFNRRLIESVPNSVVDVKVLGIDTMIVRMDYDFNEENLVNQMRICPVSILTNKPIRKQILIEFKERIREIIYFVEKDNDPEFISNVQDLNVRHILISSLNDEELSDIKLDYMDFNAVINRKSIKRQSDIEDLVGRDIKKLFYKSNKFTLSEGKVFASWADLKVGNSVENFNEIQPVIDNDDFWQDLEYFSILEKTD